MIPRVLLRQALDNTAGQLEPSLSELEEALGETVDPGSFALGMLVSGFAATNTDAVEIAKSLPDEIIRFMAKCRERKAVDLGPYHDGEIGPSISGWPPGTSVKFRRVDSLWTEVVFPNGGVKWVPSPQVERT